MFNRLLLLCFCPHASRNAPEGPAPDYFPSPPKILSILLAFVPLSIRSLSLVSEAFCQSKCSSRNDTTFLDDSRGNSDEARGSTKGASGVCVIYIYIYIYVHVCAHVYIQHIYIYTYIHIPTSIYTYLHLSLSIYIYI